MGDAKRSNSDGLSPEDKQYTEDLERAKRMSLECFESEQRLRKGYLVFPIEQQNIIVRRSSHPDGSPGAVHDKIRPIRPALDIKSRPRPFSRAFSSGCSNSGSIGNGIVVSPPTLPQLNVPSTAIANFIPPPVTFKRQRSLPYRYRQLTGSTTSNSTSSSPDNNTQSQSPSNSSNSNNNHNGKCSSPNDDLILLASPKVTPKFDQTRNRRFCDNTYAIPFDATMNVSTKHTIPAPSGMTTSPSFPTRINLPGISKNNGQIHCLNNSPLGPQVPGSIPTPMPLQVALSTQPASTSTVIGGILNSISRNHFIPNGTDSPSNHIPSHFRNAQGHQQHGYGQGRSPNPGIGFTTTPPLPLFSQNREKVNTPLPQQTSSSSSSSLYKRVSDELKYMTSTQGGDLIDFGVDSKNILEYFDPLIIKERWMEEQEQKRLNEFKEPKVRGLKSDSQDVVDVESTYNASITSGASTATSAFTFKRGSGGPSSLSLYPSLEEFECESLYVNLQAGQDGRHNSDASSFYDAYNPFEYLYTVSCSSPSASSAYEPFSLASQSMNSNGTLRSIGFSHYLDQLPTPVIPPALPPRNIEQSDSARSSPTSTLSRIQIRTRSISHDKSKRSGKLYENIESIKLFASTDSEIQGFYEMIRELRFSFRHVDSDSNKGFIRSSTLEIQCSNKGFSVKIIVWPETFTSEPVAFTSEISAGIEMVVEQSIMELEIIGSARDYILRVKGLNEYLDTEVPLSNYRYVQQCIKLDQDIQLVLVKRSSLDKNSWARTPKDDAKAVNISIDDILPRVQAKTINYNDISIPLEVIDRESDRIKEKLILYLHGSNNNHSSTKDSVNHFLSPALLMQPVKAVCVLLGEVVTVEIVNSLDLFIKACDEWNAKIKVSSPIDRSYDPELRRRPKIGSDVSISHSFVEILPGRRNSLDESLKDFVMTAIDKVTDSVRNLVEMYSKSFPVSFRMKENIDKKRQESNSSNFKPMSDMIESFILRVGAVHRLKPEWLTTYTNYILTADVFHGTRWMGKATTGIVNVIKAENHWFFNTIVVDSWVNFEHLPVCILPRESRIVFTLFGRKPNEDNSSNYDTIELGWTSMQCFNFKGLLAQGTYLLPFWAVGLVQKRLGPAPNSSFSSDANAPLLTIEFTDFGYDLFFPEIPSAVPISREFQTLDNNTQLMLKDIVENSTFTKFPAEDREVLWEKRHYLHEYPNALPKVLLAAQLWDWASLAELHAMLQRWRPLDPVDALQLLLPCFPDAKVREEGIRRISYMPDEELINLLPQLAEALSYETFDLSPLARFLLKKSLCSLQIAHYLFWLLASQVGLGKWTSSEEHCDPVISRLPKVETENTYDPKRRRLELMLNSLMTICGEKLKWGLISQFKMIEGFSDVALQVKATSKDSARTAVLVTELLKVHSNVFGSGVTFPLPISPSTDVIAIDTKSCSYYNSNALPLKLTFKNGLPEGDSVSAIYKLGDDLRQDMLTIQTIRVIEKWWLRDGLDLRVLTFSCVPTGCKQGIVEMVPNAETLCKIQAEHGVTGVFRDSAIAEWLAKMNPSTLDYRRAIDNFTLSCAAYCVVTYVLGICDRHNDNIMLTKKGHLFHIDFGKFLGDAQMFINFKRDRTPFVLTSDMVYVINDGEKGSHRFHRFVELCCKAFRIIRKNGNVLLNLFALMATAGIPGVDLNSVSYIQKALLPECSNVEAAARFTRFIEESSQNWFTPVNFFLHSLAQLRFTSESTDDPRTLSFVPTIYTMELDGRIEKAVIVSYQKKYDPEKYYLYTIKVKRKSQTEWSLLHRSYKEFLEFHTKLCINFPKAVGTLKSLQRGSGLGRSNVKQVAEKRRFQIQLFLGSLFTLADEISHSNLVYTFFHPLLRDEEQHLDDEFDRKSSARASLSKSPSRIHGQVKLSIEYQRGALLVLVLHAVDLACPNGQPPSPYVKTYLQPDSSRVTKRKTRVVRRSQHPTFMEMIEYRLPLDIIRMKSLQVSVWHHDSLQENNFLGGVSIVLASLALDKELTETYILGNITSTA